MEGLRLHKSATHRQSNKVNTRLQIMAYRIYLNKARFFLLVDLREIFFRFRVEGTKKKALKMTS